MLTYAILESAGITLPTGLIFFFFNNEIINLRVYVPPVSCDYLLFAGTLQISYDELGGRYEVPNYCLRFPLNLLNGAQLIACLRLSLTTTIVDKPPRHSVQLQDLNNDQQHTALATGTTPLRVRCSNGVDYNLKVDPSCLLLGML